MKELFNIYVVYNPKKEYVIRWESDNSIVLYGSELDATYDCNEDEIVITADKLNKKYQDEILLELKQLN
jgi:hypothetical protein